MQPILNIVLPLLAGICIVAALFFIWQAFAARAQFARETYGVGQQEARQTMQVNMIRGIFALVVGLILLGVSGLSTQAGEDVILGTTNTPSLSPTSALPVTTAAPSLTETAVPTVATTIAPAPTTPVPTATATLLPTDTPPPTPRTAVVSSEVGVWLRAAPSTEAEQLERVLNGTVLTLLSGLQEAEGFTWQQVRTPEGREGWVAVDFITVNE